MKVRYKLLGLSSVLLLLGFGLLLSTRNVSAAAEGKISGTIKLDGTAPHQKPIDMSKEPTCAKIHEGHPVTTETVVIGSGAGLQNVVVYISEGLPVGAASQVSAETPSFDQKGCQYIPHVLALDVNQHFKVTNSDQTSHNIHPMPTPGGANHEWNKSQPPGAAPFDVSWTAPEVAVHVKCNIHPWMSGYMAVVKGPYGVTDNSGSFTINNVPPGDYTLTAWQESYGTQTLKVSVGAGKPATADFTFKAK
jgi:Carboxypeptidase regulatory-like domain